MENIDYCNVSVWTPECYDNLKIERSKKNSIPSEGMLTSGSYLKFFHGDLEIGAGLNCKLPKDFLEDPAFSEKIMKKIIMPAKLKITKEIDSAQEFIDKIRQLAKEKKHQ